MIQNKDIAVAKGGKDSRIVIMKKLNFVAKLEIITHDCIRSYCIEATENKLKEQSRFQNILLRNFYNHKRYKDMKPDSNQPAYLYGAAKTHKF